MFIPGRIEFLGKHTDYCGGQSIVCAIDRGFHADVEPRNDSNVVMTNRDTNETICLSIDRPRTKPWHWAKYAAEVINRIRHNFSAGHRLNGVTITFSSDLPRASGMSSSSALMILVYTAMAARNDLAIRDRFKENISNGCELAEYLGCIENGQSFKDLAGSAGVGTFGGSQDHAAILLSRAKSLSLFSFAPLCEVTAFEFPSDHTFIIASSGVVAAKTGAAREHYNRISLLARSAAAAASETNGPLARVIEKIGMDELRDRIAKTSSDYPAGELLRRVEQFYRESFEIIPQVAHLLATGIINETGELIDASQKNAERLLGNQVKETIFLQRIARKMGAICSSAFGAGFGGSVYAVVKAAEAETFLYEWRKAYLTKFPHRSAKANFFATRPSQAELRPSETDFAASL